MTPRNTIDDRPVTHFVELDARRSRYRSWSVCGELVDTRDTSDQPTCPECQHYLDPGVTADQLFGGPHDHE